MSADEIMHRLLVGSSAAAKNNLYDAMTAKTVGDLNAAIGRLPLSDDEKAEVWEALAIKFMPKETPESTADDFTKHLAEHPDSLVHNLVKRYPKLAATVLKVFAGK